jgi:hypothetical protein
MLGATGCKQGHFAVALGFKPGYTVLKCLLGWDDGTLEPLRFQDF